MPLSKINKFVKEKSASVQSILSSRRRKIRKSIMGDAALFMGNPEVVASRDVYHPYRQNSDFFYLTGIEEPGCALLILGNNKGPRSILFLRDRDESIEQWVGERIGISRAKRRYGFDEVKDINEIEETLLEYIKTQHKLYYALGSDDSIDAFISEALKTSVGPNPNFPVTLSDSRVLTSPLRLIKDKREIKCIRHAANITAHSFMDLVPQLKKVSSEIHAARLIEANFAKYGGPRLAFPTIVASGKNATCLHHSPSLQPLWQRELVLIDAGASFQGYAADITRTFPVLGKFTTPQAEIYDLVHFALTAAINRAKKGSTLTHIHDTVVRTLTRGLVELGILEGTVQDLIKNEEYKRFFMHGSGHWLGLDVHDIAPAVPKKQLKFVPGHVFTIEPGLYFNPKDKSIPKEYRGIGIRLEEDVLITEKGNSVLSQTLPIARDDIEQLMS